MHQCMKSISVVEVELVVTTVRIHRWFRPFVPSLGAGTFREVIKQYGEVMT